MSSTFINSYNQTVSLGSTNQFTNVLSHVSNEDIHRHLNKIGTLSKKKVSYRFNWYRTSVKDLLSPVFDQKNCACCWAVAVANSINNNVITQKISKINPQIHPTYLLSCWENNVNLQCGGSNPAIALLHISKFGIQSQNDHYNYNWCLHQPVCDKVQTELSYQELNSYIPSCSKDQKSNKKLYVTDIKHIVVIENQENVSSSISPSIIDQHILYTKHIIQHRGPIILGFPVYQNLIGGRFQSVDNPNNIYLDQVDYKTNTRHPMDHFSYLGEHAVLIVGWDYGKVKGRLLGSTDTYEPNRWYKVPYWIIQNSWGIHWGTENGYFRLAMYPFNTHVQTEITRSQTYYSYLPEHNIDHYLNEPLGGKIIFDIVPPDVIESFTMPSQQMTPYYRSFQWICGFCIIIILILCISYVICPVG